MQPNGIGRSNALPVIQIVLGAALAVIGVLAAVVGRGWIEWFIAVAGAVQIALGVVTYRRNNRLDAEESAAEHRNSGHSSSASS